MLGRPSLSTMQPGGRASRLARATRTFPSATTVVAKSTTTGSAPVGTPSDQGLVPRKRAAPPKGVAPPIPGPAAPTVTWAT